MTVLVSNAEVSIVSMCYLLDDWTWWFYRNYPKVGQLW